MLLFYVHTLSYVALDPYLRMYWQCDEQWTVRESRPMAEFESSQRPSQSCGKSPNRPL